jgi:hypothetical protein
MSINGYPHGNMHIHVDIILSYSGHPIGFTILWMPLEMQR